MPIKNSEKIDNYKFYAKKICIFFLLLIKSKLNCFSCSKYYMFICKLFSKQISLNIRDIHSYSMLVQRIFHLNKTFPQICKYAAKSICMFPIFLHVLQRLALIFSCELA